MDKRLIWSYEDQPHQDAVEPVNVAKPVRMAYRFDAMNGNCKWQLGTWIVLGAYMTLALLPAGSVVYCISESGHSAIELMHDDCPHALETTAPTRQIVSVSSQEPYCTDTRLTLCADHLPKESNTPLMLLSGTFSAIQPDLPSYQPQYYPGHNLPGHDPKDHQTDHLRSVVLLI